MCWQWTSDRGSWGMNWMPFFVLNSFLRGLEEVPPPARASILFCWSQIFRQSLLNQLQIQNSLNLSVIWRLPPLSHCLEMSHLSGSKQPDLRLCLLTAASPPLKILIWKPSGSWGLKHELPDSPHLVPCCKCLTFSRCYPDVSVQPCCTEQAEFSLIQQIITQYQQPPCLTPT